MVGSGGERRFNSIRSAEFNQLDLNELKRIVASSHELLGELVKRTTKLLTRALEDKEVEKQGAQWKDAVQALAQFYATNGMKDSLARAACATSLEWQDALQARDVQETKELVESLKLSLQELKQSIVIADGLFRSWEQSPSPENNKSARRLYEQCLHESSTIGLFVLTGHWFAVRQPNAFVQHLVASCVDDERRIIASNGDGGAGNFVAYCIITRRYIFLLIK
jgi:hypothetical protein